MGAQTTSGFVKLRRGLDEHLPRMSGDTLKLYLALLFRASWRKGPSLGVAEVNLRGDGGIEEYLGWKPHRSERLMRELTSGGYVVVERKGNQYRKSVIRVCKYDRASYPGVGSYPELPTKTATASYPSVGSYVGSTFGSSNCGNHLRSSKKSEEVEEKVKKAENMFDPTDERIETTPELRSLGIASLPAAFQAFVQFASKFEFRKDETTFGWGLRLLDACPKAGVRYPRALLKITQDAKRAGAAQKVGKSTWQRIQEERRLRAAR